MKTAIREQWETSNMKQADTSQTIKGDPSDLQPKILQKY